MRILSIALAVFGFFLQAVGSPSLRVATCELADLEPSQPDTPPTDEEVKALRQVAANLKLLDAEVIVVHGLPDRQVARRLVGHLKPLNYHLALHSTFRNSGAASPIVGPPITVLTRKQPFASRAMEWRMTSQIEWPGGFGFVGFHAGTNSICVYVAHLPGEPAAASDREHPLMARRRDLAAQYLVHHANWLGSALSNQLVCALITGDFIAEAKGTRSEGAVQILQQAGFKMAMPSSLGAKAPAPSSTPGEATMPAPRLTLLLARNAELISTAQVSSRKTPTLASYEVAPTPTAAPGPGPTAATHGLARPVPARVVALDQSILWLWVGGVGALCIASLFSVWIIRRTFSAAGVLGRRGQPSVVLDVSPFHGKTEPYALPRQPGDSYSASTADALWQERAVQAERQARTASLLSGALRPQLSRLLRERLVAWLSFQRRALLTSHELGAKQMFELESRLKEVQGRFQDRLRSREARIAELEQEVRAKEKIIRSLLRTQVRLANETAEDSEQS